VPASPSFERTRALIAKGLRVTAASRDLDAYRDAIGDRLSGEWLGGFARSGTLLARFTAMSVAVEDGRGVAVDEYGESAVALVGRGDHVEFTKRATSGDRLVFVGRRHEGAIAGIVYEHPRVPIGVFWLARVEQLTVETADALRGKIHVTSSRVRALAAAYGVLWCGVIGGAMFAPPVAIGSCAALGVAALVAYAPRLRHEIRAWQRELDGVV
jgi:hypothetical protein